MIDTVRMVSNDVMPMIPQALERELGDRTDAAIENELCTLNANLNAATYRFLVLIREFDLRRAWGDWGMCSMAHWLGWRCGIGIVAAREHLRLAHALAALPATVALFAEGRISFSKVRALTRVATVDTEGFFINVAQHGTAGHLERIVRYARRGLAFDDPDRVRSLVAKSFCDWHYDDDGMLVLRARLMADDGAKLVAALESMREHVVGESTLPSRDAQNCNSLSALPVSARRAVALAAIAEAAAGMVIDPDRDCANGTSRSVPQIVVHIHSLPSNGPHGSAESSVCVDDSGREDSAESSVCTDERCNDDSAESSERADQDRARDSAESLGHVHREHATECENNSSASPSYIENAVAIPVATAQRLSCDASVVAMIERADGAALSIGRRRRTIPPAIRRAMQSRDPSAVSLAVPTHVSSMRITFNTGPAVVIRRSQISSRFAGITTSLFMKEALPARAGRTMSWCSIPPQTSASPTHRWQYADTMTGLPPRMRVGALRCRPPPVTPIGTDSVLTMTT